jgi:hypothetical protein
MLIPFDTLLYGIDNSTNKACFLYSFNNLKKAEKTGFIIKEKSEYKNTIHNFDIMESNLKDINIIIKKVTFSKYIGAFDNIDDCISKINMDRKQFQLNCISKLNEIYSHPITPNTSYFTLASDINPNITKLQNNDNKTIDKYIN